MVLLPRILLRFRNELAFKAHGRRTKTSLHYRSGLLTAISALIFAQFDKPKKVFLLILGLGLISSILQGVLEIHLTEAARAATGYFPDISDADRHLVIALRKSN